jgi:DNA-directed RNA polymerase, mitochondrial
MDRAGHILPLDAVTAGLMTGSERFYVPLNIDFRGRIYGASHFNFQREDHVRALFLFADGEPIGEEGLLWLKAHVAARADGNSWSQETKPSNLDFDGRVAWTDANLATLRQVGEAILSGDKPATWVLDRSRPEGPKISEPYQFLAACVELVQALDQGPGFITRLPLTLDATCSGLQHLCGMTRAEEGRYVNLSATPVGLEPGGGVAVTEADPELIASFEADDFYRRVAHRAWEKVSEKFPDLMQGPFDREIVKQPAMSYFHGARAGGWAKDKRGKWHSFGMTKQVVVVLKDREKSSEGARELAEAIYEVIEDMVPLATAVRAFLEHLATQAVDKGEHLRWTTPLGLPVINRYHPPKIARISVSLNGRRRRVKLVTGDKEGIAKKKAVNAVTANFVHSVDAALLQMVALAAAKEGICMVSVHDCFGTIPSRAGRLGNIIREQFVRLHKRHNLLNEVRESAKRDLRIEPPPAPETGNAEIEDVLASFFAFK